MPKVTRDSYFQINQRISTEGREYQGVAVIRDRQVCQKGVIKEGMGQDHVSTPF